MAFLTSGRDITQIWFFHTQHLDRWSSLPSVTFLLSDTPWAADCTDHMPTHKYTLCLLTHPKALLLSSQPKTSSLITKDYSDLLCWLLTYHTLTPAFIRPLSIKTCYSNTHLLYSPLICSSSCLQQVRFIPSAVWNLTLWESNGSVTNLPGEGPEPQSIGTRPCHLIPSTHTVIILPNMPPPHQLHLQNDSSLCPWQNHWTSHKLVESLPLLLDWLWGLYNEIFSQTKVSLISQNQSLNEGMITVKQSRNTVFPTWSHHEIYHRTSLELSVFLWYFITEAELFTILGSFQAGFRFSRLSL